VESWSSVLGKFLFQTQTGELKTASYPKEWGGLKLRVSFGQGVAARVPWVAFIAPEMQVSKGFYPVYLYYREFNTLILAYGVSETEEFAKKWPSEIVNDVPTIRDFFGKDIPRYGGSFVYKAYKISFNNRAIQYLYPNGRTASASDLESDLSRIVDYFKKVVANEVTKPDSPIGQGVFYLEKQLEDFLINNWERTELGKKYDLIVEDGEVVSRQFKTDVSSIDILAKDKKTGSYVVIELKKNQTSDDTVGQVARYMGWIKEKKGDSNVKGIIIASEFDEKLEYALRVVPNVEVFLYKVDFQLTAQGSGKPRALGAKHRT
jgi:Endonuclease NucS C-terminal domain/MrcB-like, N-terminal domain